MKHHVAAGRRIPHRGLIRQVALALLDVQGIKLVVPLP
jgi:hypothetical protein